MQNLLKNKLFIIFLMFLMLTFLSTKVLATSNESNLMSFNTYKGLNVELEIPPFPDCTSIEDFGYVILELSGKDVFLIYFSKSLNTNFPYITSDSKFVVTYDSFSQASGVKNFKEGLLYKLDISSNSWAEDGSLGSATVDGKNLFLNSFNDIYYSTVDIYDRNGNVVFQQAPQLNQIPDITKTLVEQTTQLGMKPLIQIKTLLPIVIATILGLIGFWKAWQLLFKNLKKA